MHDKREERDLRAGEFCHGLSHFSRSSRLRQGIDDCRRSVQ